MGFREMIEYFADSSNPYTRDELYMVFLDVTRRYLEELLNARNLENVLISQHGEEVAEEFMEALATCSAVVEEADRDVAESGDPRKSIAILFEALDKMKGEDPLQGGYFGKRLDDEDDEEEMRDALVGREAEFYREIYGEDLLPTSKDSLEITGRDGIDDDDYQGYDDEDGDDGEDGDDED